MFNAGNAGQPLWSYTVVAPLSLSLSSPAPWMPPCGQSGAPSLLKIRGSCNYVLNSKAAHSHNTCDASLHQRKTKSLGPQRHTSAMKLRKEHKLSRDKVFLHIFRLRRYMGEISDGVNRRWNLSSGFTTLCEGGLKIINIVQTKIQTKGM